MKNDFQKPTETLALYSTTLLAVISPIDSSLKSRHATTASKKAAVIIVINGLNSIDSNESGSSIVRHHPVNNCRRLLDSLLKAIEHRIIKVGAVVSAAIDLKMLLLED